MDHLTMADAAAVILVGGKSSRMGRAKALLPFPVVGQAKPRRGFFAALF